MDEAPGQPGKQDGDVQHHQHCGSGGKRFGHHRPDALARVVDLEKYALLGHSHEISDVSGLANTLSDHAASIDLLNDLVSGDMPGGINKTADFATLAGITMRDGVWSQTGRSITA